MSQTFYEITRRYQISNPAGFKRDASAMKNETTSTLEDMADDGNCPQTLRAMAQLELARRNGKRPEID